MLDPSLKEKQETRGLPRRGRSRGSRVQNYQESADSELDIFDNPSNVLEVDPGSEEMQGTDIGILPKNKGRGRPRLSRVQSYQESVDNELDILDNPSNALEVDPALEERQEADKGILPKNKERGRPRGSRVQNCQESPVGNLTSHINQSNMAEASPGCEESEETDTATTKEMGRGRPRGSRVQNCQENADYNLIMCIASEMMEVCPGSEEEQEAAAGVPPKKRGRGRPKGSVCQTNLLENADNSVKPKRKGRGRTRGLALERKRQQSADGKLDVLIHPTKLVAVGPGRKDFITDLALIVRQNARHNVYRWRLIPESTRDTIVEKILNNWRLQDTDVVRRAILDEAGRLYRNWRNRLHDHYLMFETKEEAVKHVPDDIDASDWQFLVDYFSSPLFKMLSSKNKANKAKQTMKHTSGRKPFLAVSYDARDKATGKEPDLQTLWQLTHKRANGEWIDEASKEVNDKVAEQVEEKLRQIEDSQLDIETIEPEIVSTAFKSVVGKKSYMQGFSAGQKSSSSIEVVYKQLQAELEAQKRETENSRKECNEIRARLAEVESELEEEQRKREETELCLVNRQKEMQEINNQVQTAIQSALLPFCPPVQAEVEAQKRETENARKECNELRARLFEVESQLEEEQQKREEAEVCLANREKGMQEINSQVQTAIQTALSHYRPQTSQTETISRQRRKIAELEAQLIEAEDVITDLRSELRRYGRR
ncbi:hypothetical protein RIF29_42125 [Crotalaria pallida]|uniref:Uncharacterized protein n=1 Tax=Crotalaria pallida TaxID=3830 RepID=A0AAN9HS98_CROPI